MLIPIIFSTVRLSTALELSNSAFLIPQRYSELVHF